MTDFLIVSIIKGNKHTFRGDNYFKLVSSKKGVYS